MEGKTKSDRAVDHLNPVHDLDGFKETLEFTGRDLGNTVAGMGEYLVKHGVRGSVYGAVAGVFIALATNRSISEIMYESAQWGVIADLGQFTVRSWFTWPK